MHTQYLFNFIFILCTNFAQQNQDCKRCLGTNMTVSEYAKDVKDLTESVLHKNQRQIRNSRRSTTTNLEEVCSDLRRNDI